MCLWSLPLLISPPLLSSDAFVYAAAGWVQHSGASVYSAGLSASGGPYIDAVSPIWRPGGVAYPPVALLAAQASAQITGFHPYWGVVAQRLPALCGLGLVLACSPRLAAATRLPLAITSWWVASPLIIVHLVGGAHNDGLMVGLVGLGVWVAVSVGFTSWAALLAGSGVLGLAMLAKPQAGLGVIALGLCGYRSAGAAISRLAVASAVTLAAFAGGCAIYPDGFGWTRWLKLNDLDATESPTHWLLSAGNALSWLWADTLVRAGVMLAGVVGIGALLWISRRHPARAFAWCSLVFRLASPALYPWYLVLPWVAFGFAAVGSRSRTWLITGVIGYALLNIPPLLRVPPALGWFALVLAVATVWWITQRLGIHDDDDMLEHVAARA
ncbi:MAG TPA: polyprenol phosphomannose-dependent alpha 1,6 mannosyltransferase MptB [Propionibacteriaceae bacterium]|nr:polyprenol phosphomannose-dependent alpha 1,6 mannosyltransferase MptB [Propionibacteriaceae bacterium]HQE30658.1 polyprenol phosphomannose-dependent alpha 1,6 mannosyltransferase MptB [Propionibacteriaceae bacterium]